jgi:putative tryptophan/tyrosine transport system substrate-binding protein
VGNSSPSLEPKLLGAFRDGLRDLGYVEGQNHIEYRWAEGRYERFPDFMAELVQLKIDLIVVAGTPATLAAKRSPMWTRSSKARSPPTSPFSSPRSSSWS